MGQMRVRLLADRAKSFESRRTELGWLFADQFEHGRHEGHEEGPNGEIPISVLCVLVFRGQTIGFQHGDHGEGAKSGSRSAIYEFRNANLEWEVVSRRCEGIEGPISTFVSLVYFVVSISHRSFRGPLLRALRVNISVIGFGVG